MKITSNQKSTLDSQEQVWLLPWRNTTAPLLKETRKLIYLNVLWARQENTSYFPASLSLSSTLHHEIDHSLKPNPSYWCHKVMTKFSPTYLCWQEWPGLQEKGMRWSTRCPVIGSHLLGAQGQPGGKQLPTWGSWLETHRCCYLHNNLPSHGTIILYTETAAGSKQLIDPLSEYPGCLLW